jgi:ABC-type multidrug transport system permease subunit
MTNETRNPNDEGPPPAESRAASGFSLPSSFALRHSSFTPRPALLIGHNDLRLFLRNRASFIWLFVIPLAFVYFMGFANRRPGSPSAPRPTVVMDNRDAGFLGSVFLDALGAQGLNALSPTNADTAKRGVRLATNFTAEVLAGRQARVEFFTVGSADTDPASALVSVRMARALIALNSDLVEYASAHGRQTPTAAALKELQQRPNPVALDATYAGRKPIPSGFNLSLPGVLVMYLMMNLLIFGGASVAWERRSGVLRRMAALPVSRGAVIGGKVYGLMLLALVQIVVLLLAGRFLFHVNLGDALGGILVVLLVYAWVAASLGVLVGSLVRAEDKVVGLCVLASIVMAALGGCWWPLEFVPESVKVLAHCVPTGWAMDALHQLITFGGGLAEAKLPLAVLALFGLAANAAAAKFFRS